MSDFEQMIRDCEARESRLTEWEASFIDSLQSQMAKGRPVTQKQEDTLERIWDKVTSKG